MVYLCLHQFTLVYLIYISLPWFTLVYLYLHQFTFVYLLGLPHVLSSTFTSTVSLYRILTCLTHTQSHHEGLPILSRLQVNHLINLTYTPLYCAWSSDVV